MSKYRVSFEVEKIYTDGTDCQYGVSHLVTAKDAADAYKLAVALEQVEATENNYKVYIMDCFDYATVVRW